MAANTSLTPTDLLSHSESLVPSVNFSDPMDISEYISHQLGPPHLALQTLIPLTVIYGIIFTLGFLGNISTCLVVFKYKYMQTPTNVYLSNLAISDLVTGCIAMEANACKQTYKKIDDLNRGLEAAWDDIPVQIVRAAVDAVPTRLRALIRARR
eukprot:snap_masked-scaffold263_size232787-processed-gene-0.6 protein:Tk11198 transcript:snap_masked-scaffold263_size232787-processed-gene-0.6-mRNA-1 annotation:"neuropeptides capa receptor-like"